MHTSESITLSVHLPAELLSAIISIAAPPPTRIISHDTDYYSLLSFALVSHDWNERANSVLYGTIARKWDSRMLLLVRTFDERPDLLARFRSLDTYFPDISNWDLHSSKAGSWEDELYLLQRQEPPGDRKSVV